ncbi:MAG: DUF4350 domain-containing protein [Flavisolibacter sp.]|jgi:hypothetical protein|nr:DUF4350 domain-containing protein [Flavisolibacter sp.]
MKRFWPYLVIVAAVLLLGTLLVSSSKKRPREMDERITLKKADKIPYGTAAAKDLLTSVFPGKPVYYNKKEPELWDSINRWGTNQAVFIIADYLNAYDDELERIFDFAQGGNYVFIIAKNFSGAALKEFGFQIYYNPFEEFGNDPGDSLGVRLEPSYFKQSGLFLYPGKKYESYFTALDTSKSIVLGRNQQGWPNFIQMNAGTGRVFIHTAPLAFSNYFLLHKDNHQYFEQVLGLIPSTVDQILWNEYYLVKPKGGNQDEPGWLHVLMQYPPFKWGLLTGLFALCLFVLLNMRRKQRMIPEMPKPKNDSLDFIKTMGRLYYHQKDHRNLAVKMGSYFLDHVRSRYKLGTVTLDETFINTLHYKSGYPLNELKPLVSFIQFLKDGPAISERQLASFHKQLELFYQKT